EGRKRSELSQRMREPLPIAAPRAKLRVAAHVLESLARDRTSAAVPPREARWRVFRTASANQASRELVMQRVASELSINASDLEAALFADLRGERRVPALPEKLCPEGLALRANLAIAGSLLRRAATVRVAAWGNTRALVRHARLVGLICTVVEQEATR